MLRSFDECSDIKGCIWSYLDKETMALCNLVCSCFITVPSDTGNSDTGSPIIKIELLSYIITN